MYIHTRTTGYTTTTQPTRKFFWVSSCIKSVVYKACLHMGNLYMWCCLCMYYLYPTMSSRHYTMGRCPYKADIGCGITTSASAYSKITLLVTYNYYTLECMNLYCVYVTSIIHGNAALTMHNGTHHIIQVK